VQQRFAEDPGHGHDICGRIERVLIRDKEQGELRRARS
jgi:hypothetical protein